MPFKYQSLSGITLTPAEEELLESIDNFSYHLLVYANLGDLHSKLKGGVELSGQKKIRSHSYNITANERKTIIDKLNTEISKIEKKPSELCEKFADVKRKKLEKTRDIYEKAGPCNGGFEIQVDIDLLGEYDPLLKKVILYYNNIYWKALSENIPSKDLLAVVYVHEMMHAYLDVDCPVISEIEEPIVESAMLGFFKYFGYKRLHEINSDDDWSVISSNLEYAKILEYAKMHVVNKQICLGVAHYGFGYYIYQNVYSIYREYVYWIEDYKSVKRILADKNYVYTLLKGKRHDSLERGLAGMDSAVASYLDYWKTGSYPFNQEQDCLKALYNVLHGLNNINYIVFRMINDKDIDDDEEIFNVDQIVLKDVRDNEGLNEYIIPDGV